MNTTTADKGVATVPGLVSVVLVNLNGKRLLEKFLPSLFAQGYRDVEITMVDNGSKDGSVELVRKDYPSVRIMQLEWNHGFSVPNNMAIRESNGQFVLTLNIDMLIEPDFVERLVEGLKGDPAAGWAAPKLLKLTPAFEKASAVDCFGHHMTRTRFAREADYSVPFDLKDYDYPRYVFGASACGALYRREMLEDIAHDGEYFDEDFFAYFEDVDLDWRAQLRGWKCLYVPQAVGYHIRGGTELKAKNPSIAACEFSNRYFMMMKDDTFRHVVQDIGPIVKRSIKETLKYMVRNPKAMLIGFWRIARLMPRFLHKRRLVQSRRKVAAEYIRGMIRGIG